MARYDAAHKQASRDRIVEAARHQFRTRGFDAASIDELMKAAGLTRGAFYAHFASKEELVLEVLAIEAGLVNQLNTAAENGDVDAASAAIEAYLDPAERADVAANCPLVAHPVDAIRGDDGRRGGYTKRLQAMISAMEGQTANGDDAVLASIVAVGSAQLAAAVGDDDLAERLQRVGRAAVADLMTR